MRFIDLTWSVEKPFYATYKLSFNVPKVMEQFSSSHTGSGPRASDIKKRICPPLGHPSTIPFDYKGKYPTIAWEKKELNWGKTRQCILYSMMLQNFLRKKYIITAAGCTCTYANIRDSHERKSFLLKMRLGNISVCLKKSIKFHA